MHINEVEAFAFKTALDTQFAGRKAKVVVILPKDGKKFYVSRRGGTTENKDEAFVYDYDIQAVGYQCEQVFLSTGNKPEVVEV